MAIIITVICWAPIVSGIALIVHLYVEPAKQKCDRFVIMMMWTNT